MKWKRERETHTERVREVEGGEGEGENHCVVFLELTMWRTKLASNSEIYSSCLLIT